MSPLLWSRLAAASLDLVDGGATSAEGVVVSTVDELLAAGQLAVTWAAAVAVGTLSMVNVVLAALLARRVWRPSTRCWG